MLEDKPFMAFIPVTELAGARAFYEGVLGLRVTDENPYALVVDAGGTMLRLTKVDALQPQPFTMAGWAVADIGHVIDELVDRGVAFVRYDGMEQDERAVWSTPNGDQIAWFRDPDGNTLSLTCFAK